MQSTGSSETPTSNSFSKPVEVAKEYTVEMNDSDYSFDEIADYLDKVGGSKY